MAEQPSNDAAQIQRWLDEHRITEVECLIPDMAGQARGKSYKLYQWMHGALPISSSAERRSPNSWTSSAPNDETPTSVTHTGCDTARWISASLSGHSSICQWFQSSGKPCTATTFT